MSKVLHLTLKRYFFDMVLSGKKTEEYRDIKTFWIKRFIDTSNSPEESFGENKSIAENMLFDLNNGHDWKGVSQSYHSFVHKFDSVEFKNGYAKGAPTILVEFKGIEIGHAKPEWSDNWEGQVFIIKLGEITYRKNCEFPAPF